MSAARRRNRDERQRREEAAGKLPPSNRIPLNLDGKPLFKISHYHIGSWCPLPDGKGPAEAVAFHLVVELADGSGDLLEMALRLKTPRAVDELIASLERHRNDVWPGG